MIEQPDTQLGYLLTQLSLLKQRIINTALQDLDITYMQFIILAGIMELGEQFKVVTQQTIVSERRLDKAMVSTVIKTLATKGLIIRHPHPTDKRAYILSLTKQGKYKAMEGKKIATEKDKVFFNETDKEYLLRIFNQLLQANK